MKPPVHVHVAATAAAANLVPVADTDVVADSPLGACAEPGAESNSPGDAPAAKPPNRKLILDLNDRSKYTKEVSV